VRRYYLRVYAIQLIAALMMQAAIPLRWHTEHGAGARVLQKALDTRLAFGLADPFNPDYIPVSQWWIVWCIVGIGGVFGLRAAVGFLLLRLETNPRLIGALVLLMLLAFGWYLANFYDEILLGFWAELFAAITLILALGLEHILPSDSPQERRLQALPLDHPERIAAGYYVTCPYCGEINEFGEKACWRCQTYLPDTATRRK